MLPVLLIMIVATTLFALETRAQTAGARWGIGVHLGEPTGLTLRTYPSSSLRLAGAVFTSYDFLLSWDLDDYIFANVHALNQRNLQGAPLQLFFGPGVFVILTDDRGDDFALGISGAFGASYFVERFEIFLQLTPRLRLIERTDGHLGGGIGVRYYF